MADKCCGSKKELTTIEDNKGCCDSQAESVDTIGKEEDSCCSSQNTLQGSAVTAINSSCNGNQSENVYDKATDDCCNQETLQDSEVKSCCSGKEDDTTLETSGCCNSNVDKLPDINATSVKDEKVEYRIHGMDCPSCALTVEKGLNALHDIQEAKVNYNTAKLQIIGNNALSLDSVESEVQKLGYKAEPMIRNNNVRTYDVEGMDCGSCAKSIENHLNTIPSVNSVNVNFSTGKMKVEHENSVDDVISEVSKIGYKALSVTNNNNPSETSKKKGIWFNYLIWYFNCTWIYWFF